MPERYGKQMGVITLDGTFDWRIYAVGYVAVICDGYIRLHEII